MVDTQQHRSEPPHTAKVARLRVVRSHSLDPFANLALEQQLFEELSHDEVVLYLWRNSASVVIGRHQNPWLECDLDAMRDDGVKLVRRVSGGGAVYHDPGNGNFTFLAPAAAYSERRQFALVIAALRALEIEAVLSERNDILIGNRKVSGNAFRYRREKSYHHGTLLVAADLDRLTRFLNPRGDGVVESKGIASVRSRVANLAELRSGLSWDDICDALTVAAITEYGAPAVHERYPSTVEDWPASRREAVVARLSELTSWDWIFGHTPDFRRVHRVAMSTAGEAVPDERTVELSIHRGFINGVSQVRSDDPGRALSHALSHALIGVRYRPEDLQQRSLQLRRERREGAEIAQAVAVQLASSGGHPLREAHLEPEPASEPPLKPEPASQEEQ